MKEGYRQPDFGQPTKRFVQVMDISDDPALMEEYRKWHSEAYSWKEVRDGIREVGILEMEIYMSGNHLVMVVDTPLDWDWQTARDRLAPLPRQAEWEAFVAQFQNCDASARSDEKWKMAGRIFRLY